MSDRPAILERRIATMSLVLVLVIVTVVFVGTALWLAGSSHRSLATPTRWVLIVVALGLVTAALCFSKVVVRVYESSHGRSLVVAYGPGGFIRQEFGPDRLVRASTEHYSILQMGGWGYRGSIRVLHRAALVTRSGEALELQLVGRRRFIITVDHPDDFVSALRVGETNS